MPVDNIEKNLERAGAGLSKRPKENEPLYRVIGDSKIPVSKHTGLLWSSRKDQGKTARGSAETAWDEALRYYDNDQSQHRNASETGSGNQPPTRLSGEWRETEKRSL